MRSEAETECGRVWEGGGGADVGGWEGVGGWVAGEGDKVTPGDETGH